ncbi:MAG: quinol:electron acceptor oxidoreductase subunit ActD [Limisphaerales bacterium]
MAGKNTAVFGIYPSYASVENGVDALRTAGFRNEDISALFPEGTGTKEFAHEKNTKAPEGATTGAGSGALVGGAMGWLLGIGAIAIPGLGPFIAAGPIMAALAGAGVGGAVGGIAGALIGMGIPEYEAKRYQNRVREGRILIAVHSENADQTRSAKQIFQDSGAEDIATAGEQAVTDRDREAVQR